MAAIRWGGRVFQTPGQLAAWLSARGLSYAQWAARHPGAAGKLSGSSVGQNVDAYGNQIANEGIGAAEIASNQADLTAAKANARAGIGSSYIDWGGPLPAGFVDKYGALDPSIQKLGQDNPYAQYNLIKRDTERGLGANVGDAASRGVVQSGGTALRAQDIGFEQGRRVYEGSKSFLGGIADAYGGVAEQARKTALGNAQSLNDTTDRIQERGVPPVGGGTASPGAGAGTGVPGAPGAPGASQGFVKPPPGGYTSEAQRQAAIASNVAWSKQQLAKGKNPWVSSPAEVAKSWISYGPASDRLTRMVEKGGASGWADLPGAKALNRKVFYGAKVGRPVSAKRGRV